MSDNHNTQTGGIWDVRRSLSVPGLVHEADSASLVSRMEAMDGVKKVTTDVRHHKVVVTYDASSVDFYSLARQLEDLGFPPAKGWWSRLKGNWYQFTDSNSRENASLPPPACCNKAPKKR